MTTGPTASPGKRGPKPIADPSPRTIRWRRTTELRLKAGLCAECGREKLSGRYMGRRCRAKKRPAAREYKRVLRDSGVCCQCAKAPATGSGLCDACYARWKPWKYAWLGLAPPANPGRVRR